MRTRLRIALELERLHRNNLKQLHPLRQLFWESTLRCNINCRHCGSDCRQLPTHPDMPFSDFLRAIDSITPHVDPHQVMIIVSGGEPLVRSDLEQNGAELKRRGFPWGMVTNGLALTPKRFDSLLHAGLMSMTVSLDGLEANHNWMRGHHDSFRHAVRAIQMAAQTKGLAWDVVTCVNQRNINELGLLKEELYRLGVRDWRLFGIDPMGRAAHQPELILTDSQFTQLLQFIEQTRSEGRMHASYSCEGFLGDFEGRVRDHLYHCAAGISVASVLIDGSISACTSIRGKYHQGNIYKDDFWDVWQNGFKPYRNRQWMKRMEPCSQCNMFRYCEGNGMHLRTEEGQLLLCHLHRINKP
ncbi:MAG: TIGR04133 family radical SAM/SPASM protein [Paludibacteraceae bacterium]|nr:TIGR04133 family radical SAM/SPASM protein [Paludibacteraceae bacterium]